MNTLTIEKRRNGNIKAGLVVKNKSINDYNNNPKFCINCGKKIELNGMNPSAVKQKIFCNHVCAAIYNNKKRNTNGFSLKGLTKESKCIDCGVKITISIVASPNKSRCDNCKKIKQNQKIHKKQVARKTIKSLKPCTVCGDYNCLKQHIKNGSYVLSVAPNDYPGKLYKGKYCLEHHLVWWKYHHVISKSNEVVHHKDKNIFNNNIENLELMTDIQHNKIHQSRHKTFKELICFNPKCNKRFKIDMRRFKFSVKNNQHNFYCCRSCQVTCQQKELRNKTYGN